MKKHEKLPNIEELRKINESNEKETVIRLKLHEKEVNDLTEDEAKKIIWLANEDGIKGKNKLKGFLTGYFGSEKASKEFINKFKHLEM